VPSRTKNQCSCRWHNWLDSTSTDQTPGRTGRWTADEDAQLKDAVQRHDGKNWIEIAALVPGRTKTQCTDRWHKYLDPSVDRTSLATGKWTTDEDAKLKDAVQRHGSTNWTRIAALVPSRTKNQCSDRWYNNLGPGVGRTSGRAVHGLPTKTAAECCGTKARWQKLEGNCLNGSKSNENIV
jgi:myb proto-oncogene protein